MTGYERFMTALAGEQPDQVPVWELIVNRPVIDALHSDVSYLDFCELEGLDAVTRLSSFFLSPLARVLLSLESLKV